MRPSSTRKKSGGRRFDTPEQEAFLGLWRTYDRLRALEDDLFEKFNLTPQQYNALRLLRASRPEALRTLTLAERLISRAPDITRMIDKLEERKLIRRERVESDRRMVLIAISDLGVELLDQIEEPLRECHTRQLGHLSEQDLEQLISLLEAARAPHEPKGNPWH